MKLYQYVGECSRSLYNQGLEHLEDLEEQKDDSHHVKTLLFFAKHADEKIEK